jgi:hypothetical protein
MQANPTYRRSNGVGMLILFLMAGALLIALAALMMLGDQFAGMTAAAETAETVDTDIARVIVNEAGDQVEKDYSHGATAHANHYDEIIECIAKGGAIQEWFHPGYNNKIKVCQIGPQLFGLQVLVKMGVDEEKHDLWAELTAYAKEKFRLLAQVERYLANSGYVRIVK